MVALLGAILMKLRRYKKAEQQLRLAIKLAPSFAKPYEDLGHLLVLDGRAKEAVNVLQTATRLDPQLESAHFNLGKALAALGRGKEADAAFEKSFQFNPDRKSLALAVEHLKQKRPEQAERLCRQVLGNAPNNVDALRLLSVIATQAGHPDKAANLLRRVISLAPDFIDAVIDLGKLLQEQHELEQAIDCFQKAVSIDPERPQAHFLLAAALAPAARTYEAVDAYRRTVALRPRHAGAWLGLGHVLKTVGRQEEAVEAYRRCIAFKPNSGETYWSLANLKLYTLSDDDVTAMLAALETDDIGEQSEVNLLFSLAKAYEDRKDFETAWQYYERGNSQQRMLEHYDPVQTEVIHDALIEVFTSEFLRANDGLGNSDNAPIFILGLPRSGSTLLEQILASHSQVEGTSELHYLGRVATSLSRNRADGINYPEAVRELGEEHFKSLGADYLQAAQMHRVEGKPRFIDKMPNNFPTIGFAHLILPNAKIIDARRHPLDGCLSCYRQLFARGQSFTYDLTDIGEYYLQYQRIMDHWHEVLPGWVLTVQYEDVVANLDSEVRRLLEYCELPFEEQCTRFHETQRPVRTASSEQVRQPIYNSAVNFAKNYEPHLEELLEVLEPILPRYAKYRL